MYILYIFLVLTAVIELLEGFNVLLIASHFPRSHHIILWSIAEELAVRNHNVTIQGYHSLDRQNPNIKELIIKQSEKGMNTVNKEFFLKVLQLGPIGQITSLGKFKSRTCEPYLNDDSSKTLLASGLQYDLVLVDAFLPYCQMAIASLVGKHIVKLYADDVLPWEVTASIKSPSYVPNTMMLMPSSMNFFQRIENTINTFAIRCIYQYNIRPMFQEVISKVIPQAGKIEEIEKRVELSITNVDPVGIAPCASMPNIIRCGGMHCRDAKQLPKDLNDFTESTGNDSFIIFSFGSNVNDDYVVASDILKHLFSAFSRLKQKVIFKLGRKLTNVPENVKVVKWMPQQDLLGHPKARLFITHSGLLSLQEAVYHGVPVIGIPFFGDQRGNIIRMKELGIGEHFDFLNITADGLYEVIMKVLKDKSYYDNMKKYSAIFKDHPDRPIDRAIFWIEYVIRHDGARHFRSAGEALNFFQYYLIDVIAFLTLVGITGFGIVICLLRFIFGKFFVRNKNSKEVVEKKMK